MQLTNKSVILMHFLIKSPLAIPSGADSFLQGPNQWDTPICGAVDTIHHICVVANIITI